MHVSSACVSNVGMSLVMSKIKQHLFLEIAVWKFFSNGYGKYQDLCSTDSINGAEKDSANSRSAAKNDWTNWQFSVSRDLV